MLQVEFYNLYNKNNLSVSIYVLFKFCIFHYDHLIVIQ